MSDYSLHWWITESQINQESPRRIDEVARFFRLSDWGIQLNSWLTDMRDSFFSLQPQSFAEVIAESQWTTSFDEMGWHWERQETLPEWMNGSNWPSCVPLGDEVTEHSATRRILNLLLNGLHPNPSYGEKWTVVLWQRSSPSTLKNMQLGLQVPFHNLKFVMPLLVVDRPTCSGGHFQIWDDSRNKKIYQKRLEPGEGFVYGVTEHQFWQPRLSPWDEESASVSWHQFFTLAMYKWCS